MEFLFSLVVWSPPYGLGLHRRANKKLGGCETINGVEKYKKQTSAKQINKKNSLIFPFVVKYWIILCI